MCGFFVMISLQNFINHKERKKGNRDKVEGKEKNNGVPSFEMLSMRLFALMLSIADTAVLFYRQS
jgi:hypothetical protein